LVKPAEKKMKLPSRTIKNCCGGKREIQRNTKKEKREALLLKTTTGEKEIRHSLRLIGFLGVKRRTKKNKGNGDGAEGGGTA